jgi:hypothetical protein
MAFNHDKAQIERIDELIVKEKIRFINLQFTDISAAVSLRLSQRQSSSTKRLPTKSLLLKRVSSR